MSDIEDYNSDSDNSSTSSTTSEKIPIQKLNKKINNGDEEEPLEEIEVEEEEDDDFGDDDVDDLEEEEDEDEDDDEEHDNDEDFIGGAGTGQKKEKKNVAVKKDKVKMPPVQNLLYNSEDDDDEDDENDHYLQKFDSELNNNYVVDFHPECSIHNYDEISIFTHVVRDNNNNVIDELHKTIPFMTKYEKARVLGQRAKQINSGATPFIKVPENVIDGYIVAELELQQKKIPFIIRRPIPGGGSEYWNLRDLEIINF